MISLTKNAADQIRAAAQQSEAGSLGLRIAAKVNDAGMLEFGMGFDEERDKDAIQESWGITLLISPHSAPLLDDVTIDFAEVTPGEQRFVFMKGDMEPPSGGCGSGGCGSGSQNGESGSRGGSGGSCGSGGCGSKHG